MLGSISAAGIAGWFGSRLLFLLPVSLVVLTPVFTLFSMEVADRLGYPLDPKHGIDVIGCTILALPMGMIALVPVALIRRSGRRQRACEERESYREFDGRITTIERDPMR